MTEGYRKNRADVGAYQEAELWYEQAGGDDAFDPEHVRLCNDKANDGNACCYRIPGHKGMHAYIWSWAEPGKPGRVWATWFS